MGQAKQELEELEAAIQEATEIAMNAGALECCEFHEDVSIKTDDADAEQRAYAAITDVYKSRGKLPSEAKKAMKAALDDAAPGDCPRCEAYQDA